MLTLSLPETGKTVYPLSRFGGMGNLLRQTAFNRQAFREYVDRSIFNLENTHILVGVLQHLSIDPEWELDYVVERTRLMSYSLSSVFKITSPQGLGDAIPNGFYREGVREHWVLIDNTKKYDEAAIRLDNMAAVVPLYSTVTKRGYKHNIAKSSKVTETPKGLAIIGLDMVELAVGWWAYMREDREKNTGISAYCCQYPLVKAQLLHNELALVNVLYEFFVKEKPLGELLEEDVTSFITLSEHKLLEEYLVSFINWATGRRLISLGHLIAGLSETYYPPLNPKVSAGKNALFAQTCWAWEPSVIKWFSIYLSIANRMKYKTSDINVLINRAHSVMVGNYQRLGEKYFKEHLIGMADEMLALSKENTK